MDITINYFWEYFGNYFRIHFKNNTIKKVFILDKSKMEDMRVLEKQYSKEYPIGYNDSFKIEHTPKYKSFFDQFEDYQYLVLKSGDQIIATCCIAQLNGCEYICDLKSFRTGESATYLFGKYIFWNRVTDLSKQTKFFGIVMEPNVTINHIATKYLFTKYSTLNLYRLTLEQYTNNKNLINTLFPNHFLTIGYKKLTLSSSGKSMNLFHVAERDDVKYVLLPIEITHKVLPLDSVVMFCLPETNKEKCLLLENANINISSKMSIIGFGCKNVNWSFIKTYMI